ncbi:MAG: hypothetical protein M3407_04790 [Acidobacteriota bacterium]|jgi:hypothetical protein|nr:hypothetical protein [Acidobacteriota bacterium]
MQDLDHPLITASKFYLLVVLCLLVCDVRAVAQSTELDFPTPVTSNAIAGRIAPLDIGDARLTTHFYTFGATRGDLIINVESVNLDGDIDLFIAGSLQPLAKITLLNLSDALKVTRTIFLRAEEQLILRVQARTPNDEAGTYRIRFDGSFVAARAPAETDTQDAATALPSPARTPDQNVRRVSSVGARIEEPSPPPQAETTSAETKDDTPPPAAKRAAKKPAPVRPATRRGTTRTRPAKKEPAPAETAAVDPGKIEATDDGKREPEPARDERATETAEERTAPAKPTTKKTARASRGRAKTRAPVAAKTEEPSAESTPEQQTALPQLGARLVVQLKDGTIIERRMSAVRRVTVEKGMLIVVLNNGKTERQLMSSVLRMAIEP